MLQDACQVFALNEYCYLISVVNISVAFWASLTRRRFDGVRVGVSNGGIGHMTVTYTITISGKERKIEGINEKPFPTLAP